jgi:photosystem II stability/assembly factor-like uncharacterized protein
MRLAAFCAALALSAQTPPLAYNGSPLQVPFACDKDRLEDLGLVCLEDEPCVIYTEFAAVHADAMRIVLAGNLQTGAITVSSLLLISTDGGATWTEPTNRVRQGSLEQIYFASPDQGYVSGQVIQSIPRDPFFLTTRDGGQTWRRRPFHTEPTIATLEGFRFEGPQAGMAILSAEGRSQRWLTTNGGDTWQMSETSTTRMQPPPAPASDPNWRIRADAKLKAHVLERREGARFAPVASFLVEAARCFNPGTQQITPPPE